MNKLRMEIKVGEQRPVSEFQLAKGETLEDRVKKELAIAVERGDVPMLGMSPTVPSIAVFEVDEDGETKTGSMAVFSSRGTEVSFRDYKVSIGKDGSGSEVTRLTGVDQDDHKKEKTEKVIGIFYDEDMARQIGSLWKSGVLD